MKSRRGAELALVIVTIIWGSTFVLVKSALEDVSTLVFLALRFSLAAIVLAAIYWKAVRRVSILPGLGAGCLLFVAYVFQTKGLELTSASKSAFLTGLSIPLVPFFNSLVYRNRPRPREIAGILIASIGMALMTLPAQGFGMSLGDLLSFLCAVTFALHIVVISHYSRALGFQTIAVVQVATAAALGLIFFRMAGPVRFHLTSAVVIALLVTGLLATALAFTVMAWSQKYTTATRSAVIFTLEPVVAWFTSWLVAGESMALRGKLGAGVILAGVLLVELTGRDETYRPGETSQ
ncbi:MAG: DMT family transporter [Acidobacteriota bacterium]|nr:DMT family transporter [Acidobacteriota bacterium]